MNRLLKQSIKILSAAVIVMTFLSYLAPYVNPALFRWFAYFGTAFPWLLVWAFRLHRFALYHLGMLVFGWQHVSGFIGLDFGKNPAPENAITLTTHNLGGLFRGIHLSDAEWNQIYVDYSQFLKSNGNPDILCTQETSRKFHQSLAKKMGYPHSFDINRGGTAILSRYPVIRGGQVPFGQPENGSIWADLKIGKRTVRVYNVHLQSNKVTYDTKRVLDDSDLQKKETWRDINKVLRKVGGATSVRAGQAKKLRDLIAASPHPVILCGDFNDTPTSYVYSQLAENLTDTFREKGLGLGTTFSGAVPFLRIDYILTDPRLKPYSCRVLRRSASDHYAVVATMGF
jgi:endonuclease/exonuclease/phosphatase (EEP) superfamily protein YafD